MRYPIEASAFEPSPELQRLTDACGKHLKSITTLVQRESGTSALKYFLKSQATLINDLQAADLDR
jgi:hypothetical protein